MLDPRNMYYEDEENKDIPLGVRLAMKFTIAEQNIVSIYKQESKFETIKAITWAMPYVIDDDVKAVMRDTIEKLESLTEVEYEMAEFIETMPEE